MSKLRAKRSAGGAKVIDFPNSARPIDVRKLLLSGQSTPTLLIPAELQEAIDARAMELSKEAYTLCREHLQRRAAYVGEWDQPRRWNLERAYRAISQGDLGDALAHTWHEKMRYIAGMGASAVFAAAQFEKDMREAMQGFKRDE